MGDFERRHGNLVDEMKKSKSMLKDFETIKNTTEDKLYETFVPILNEKKAKIVDLQRQLDAISSTPQCLKEEVDDYGSATDEDPDQEEADFERGEKRKSSVDHLSQKTPKAEFNDSLDLLYDS